MKCQRPLIGFALLLPFCNCPSAQEGVTFTNKLATFTNFQGVAYRNVRLVRTDLDGIIYREGAIGGLITPETDFSQPPIIRPTSSIFPASTP